MKLNSTSLLPGAAVALVLLVAAPGAQGAPRPDLRVASVRPATAAAAIADGTALKLRIANKGSARAARTKTVLLLSRDARRSRDDVKVARVGTRAVRAKRRVTARTTLAVPAGLPAGAYRVVACADGARRVSERRERNNCAAAPAAIIVGGTSGQTAPGSEPAPAPAPAPGSCAARPDLPDPGFTDTNCDGIDGSAAAAVFVSLKGSDESHFPGTREQPKRSINAGIAAAEAQGRTQVLVAEGAYPGMVILADGVQIAGGYDPDSWTRAATAATVVKGGVGPHGFAGAYASGIVSPTTVQQLRIESPAAGGNGTSSYGVQAFQSPALRLVDVTIEAGNGARGAEGVAPPASVDGGDGHEGGAGACDADFADNDGGPGGWSPGKMLGGQGGKGGEDEVGGSPGLQGLFGGGFPGKGGNPGTTGKAGDTGLKGSDGQPGTSGSPGAHGSIGPTGWVTYEAGSGQSGEHGWGGGGGGGGGSQTGDWVVDGAGNGGGGGGGGGQGGYGGQGGNGGGASIGLFAMGSAGLTLVRSTVAAGDGGAGGAGAAGALGGKGGKGGPGGTTCTGEVGAGGPGGPGGTGGKGGSGGGGAGGQSAVLAGLGGQITLESTTLVPGKGGAGGTGLQLNGGPAGQSGLRYGI